MDSHALEDSEAACILHSTTHCSEDKAAKEATILLHHQVRGTIPSVQAERRATIVVEWVPGSLVEEALGDRQIPLVALEEMTSFDPNKTTHSIDLNACTMRHLVRLSQGAHSGIFVGVDSAVLTEPIYGVLWTNYLDDTPWL